MKFTWGKGRNMGPAPVQRTSPRKTKPVISKTKPAKPRPEIKIICWSAKDTKMLLEALVVLASERFDANDTNE